MKHIKKYNTITESDDDIQDYLIDLKSDGCGISMKVVALNQDDFDCEYDTISIISISQKSANRSRVIKGDNGRFYKSIYICIKSEVSGDSIDGLEKLAEITKHFTTLCNRVSDIGQVRWESNIYPCDGMNNDITNRKVIYVKFDVLILTKEVVPPYSKIR